MIYDVRNCPEDEIIPLFKKMVVDNKPKDTRWDSDHSVTLYYDKGSYKISYDLRDDGSYFSFYPGVDNIRFDGWITDPECISILRNHCEKGGGTRVSDFINLSDESPTGEYVEKKKPSWWFW